MLDHAGMGLGGWKGLSNIFKLTNQDICCGIENSERCLRHIPFQLIQNYVHLHGKQGRKWERKSFLWSCVVAKAAS